jgi:hypothetical protein
MHFAKSIYRVGLAIICLSAFCFDQLSAGETGRVVFTNDFQAEKEMRRMFREMRLPSTNVMETVRGKQWKEWVNGPTMEPAKWMAESAKSETTPQSGPWVQRFANWAKGMYSAASLLKQESNEKVALFARETAFESAARLRVSRACGELYAYAASDGPDVVSYESYLKDFVEPSLDVGEQLEHKLLVEAAKVAEASMTNILALRELIVAIGALDSRGRFDFRGTGFLIKNRLFSCSHVFAKDFLTQNSTLIRDSITVGILFKDTNGFENIPTAVTVKREHLFPETDLAVIPLSGETEKKALEIDARVNNLYLDSPPEQWGNEVVFILAAQKKGDGAEMFFLKPEPLYFPPQIIKRKSRPDPVFGYVFLNHLHGSLAQPGALKRSFGSGVNFIEAVLPPFQSPDSTKCGYTKCVSNPVEPGVTAPETCQLVYVMDDADVLNLVIDQTFKMDPRIECIGVGLNGDGGMSGSPVFAIENGRHRLLGIYAGISAKIPAGQTRPTLECFGKAIPFSALQRFINHQL